MTLVSILGASNFSESEAVIQSSTNIGRELLYCLEHVIHHMTIIIIGIEQTWPEVVIEADFGVAPFTIRHYQQCAP